MSYREELDLAKTVIDGAKFAAADDRLTGWIGLENLSRLADQLASREGELVCELTGWQRTDSAGRKLGLRLRVSGRLRLRCQRCLAAVDFDCAIDNRLLLLLPDVAWPEDELTSDEYDAITASPAMSVLTLVEDEVLLALPIVPRHMQCELPAASGRADDTKKLAAPSPFAVLANLQKH